jgi:hypothetical protein
MIFLVQSPHPWRGIAQRPHHLMRRFAARGHGVRWVEPRYLRWIAERPGDFFRAKRETTAEGIQVRPATLVNGERLGFIRAHNKHWLAHAASAPAGSGSGPRVLWLYDPHQGFLADRVPHDLLVYDIMDEFGGFPWSPPRIAEEEAALLKRADWAFAGTGALYDAKRPLAEGRIEMILSGVERAHFATPMEETRTAEAHRAFRWKFRRVAGYAGMIDLRIDVDLLRRAALALPDWGFVLVGPVRRETALLRSIPNLLFAGEQKYEDLPAYYQTWDAALLPFVENTLTRHLNPTKMLEYAAAERQIVARGLPDVERFYRDGAWLYQTAEECIAALRAIDANGAQVEAKLAAAAQWAAERDWDALAERMLGRVEELTRKRNP